MIDDLNRYSSLEALKWINSKRFNKFQLLLIALIMPFYSFIQHFIFYKKYRGGFLGFVYSLSHAAIWWFKVLKYYELKLTKTRLSK